MPFDASSASNDKTTRLPETFNFFTLSLIDSFTTKRRGSMPAGHIDTETNLPRYSNRDGADSKPRTCAEHRGSVRTASKLKEKPPTSL
jgi:hypothetical protein